MNESARVRSTSHRFSIIATATLAAMLISGATAFAATYYVSTSGNDSNSGTSTGSAWRTVAKANNTLRGGDTVYLLAGTYTDDINPVNSGSAGSRITYLGSLAQPNEAVVPHIALSNDDYISIKGVTSAGEISCDANSGGASSSWDSISTCIGRTGITTAGAWNCVISNNTIGTPGTVNSKWLVAANPSQLDASGRLLGGSAITANCVFADNIMNMGASGGNPCVSFSHMRNCQFLRNQVHMMVPAGGQAAGMMIYRVKDGLFSGNLWSLENKSSYTSYLMCIRDSTRFNTFAGETFETTPNSTSQGKILFSASGTFTHSQAYNTYNSCYFHTNGMLAYQNNSTGDMFVNSVLTSPEPFLAFGDSLAFLHNTFYTTGSLSVDIGLATPVKDATWKYNIFCAKSAGTVTWLRDVGNPDVDYNLYYSPAGGPSSATYQGGIGAGTLWCTAFGNDCHSRWGDPAFLNLDPANLDLRLAANSVALTSGFWPDGYTGASATSAPPGDLIPPGAITDLHTQP